MTPSPLCPAAAVGVGGEYPLSASSASERAEADPELRKRRGEITVLTFSGQGWGECLNTTQPGLRACPLAGDDDSGDAAHRCFTMSHSALTPPLALQATLQTASSSCCCWPCKGPQGR
jgi:hypothetical protein